MPSLMVITPSTGADSTEHTISVLIVNIWVFIIDAQNTKIYYYFRKPIKRRSINSNSHIKSVLKVVSHVSFMVLLNGCKIIMHVNRYR